MKIILLKGLPASGKSTWAKDFVLKNPDYVRINRDDLRHMSGIYWLPKREDYITDLEQSAVLSALKRGFNVILDATNLNPKVKYWVEKFAGLHDSEVEEMIFDTPVEVCIERDKDRENPVGKDVILGMYKKYF